MRKFRVNILLLSILIFASSAIYGQNFQNMDSIQKVRDSIAAHSKPKSGGGTGIGVMSINPNPPAGSIAVNRDLAYQSMTPTELIQEIFVKNGGGCATVSNVSVSIFGWSTTNGSSGAWGANRGFAYFNKGTSNFPIEEGLIMSSGNVRDAEGPNSSSSALGGGATNNKDPDLQSLIPGYTATNFCSIEFDFIPTAHVMEFKYIFASEEYPEFVNSPYNDVFGFFVNEVGYPTKTNIARLPTTATGNYNVTINNVNNGYRTTNNTMGAGTNPSNSNYYTQNISGSTVTEMDGYTTVLTATYSVTPCHKYHLKLAVGNAGDQILGSAVFLQARSFDVGQDLAFSGNNILGNEYIFKDCQNNYFDVTRTINTNQAAVIQVTHHSTGGAVNGTHYTDASGAVVNENISFAANEIKKTVSLKATAAAVPGSYFDLEMECPCAGGEVAITKRIYIYDFVQSFDAAPSSSCSSGANGKITITANGTSGKYEYRLGPLGTWQTSNVFSGLSPGDYTVYVRDIGTCNTNPLSKPVTIQNLASNAGPDINNCNSNVFTLAGKAPGPGETGTWTSIPGGSASFTNANQYNTTATLTSGTATTLRWTLSNGNCSSSDDVIINNNSLPTLPTGVTTPVSYCLGATASPLTTTGTGNTGYTLKWYDVSDNLLATGTTGPTPSTATVGNTTYKVSRVNTATGCESAKVNITVTVRAAPTATISGPSVICEENQQVILTFSLTGQPNWTIDYIERNLETNIETQGVATSTSTTKTVTVTVYQLVSREYIITRVTDGANCVSTVRDSIKVQFQPCGFKSPMLLWLKANDGATSDLQKFEWQDRSQAFNIKTEAQKSSPYDNIVLQNSAINFNTAVKFNGTASRFLTGTALNPQGFSVKSTLFTVTDPTPTSSISFPQGIFSTSDSIKVGQGLFFNKPSGAPFYVMGGADLTGSSSLTNSGSANINYPILLRGIYPDSITTHNTKFWDNGVLKGTKTTGSINTYPSITPHFDVGGSSVSVGTGNVFDGKIAEIIYFHDTLSVNEADKVESYLAIKYGISLTKDYLASDGITKAFDYAGNPTFRNHIAGIGRDNGYALDQRVSQNTSPSDIVSVAHNPTAFVTDQGLAASITVDKSYLIWASNNGTKTFDNPGIYANLRLLNRRWRVRKIGTVGNVSMQFDTTGISIPAGWGSKPALVVTPAPNFSGTLTFYQAAPGYPNPTFHNVNLSDGLYFTLILTKAATAYATDQSACSNSAEYEFTLDGNEYADGELGKWEVVTEPPLGTVIISNPMLRNSKVRLTAPGTALLRWIVWNTFSLDADTAYVEITRNALPEIPYDMTMTAVCPGANNDSIVINSSNTNYRYDVYTAATGGTSIATATGTGSKITIKPGKKITESTYYYIEITNVINKCVAPVRWKVYIPVYADVVHPDIRIKVCPNPAYTLDLIQYLNAADITGYSFTHPGNPSLITDGHNINTANMAIATYTVNYSVTGHCSANTAKLYITALNNNQVPPVPKQEKICWEVDLARHVQLQQILGLNVDGGVWEFDSTLGILSLPPNNDYITTTVSGAYMFNAQKAWLDDKGTLMENGDRHFTFKYYINGSQCIPNSVYTLTIIVTPYL